MLAPVAYFGTYGVQSTFYFLLEDNTDVEAPYTGAAPVAADIWVVKDGGAPANSTNAATAEGNGWYSLVLTATEMQAEWVAVSVYDATATAVFRPAGFIVNTRLKLGTVVVDPRQIGGNVEGIFTRGLGTGSAFVAVGGATGHGIYGEGGVTSGHGIVGLAPTTGNGLLASGGGNNAGLSAVGGGTGAGLSALGGSSGGSGFTAVAQAGNGDGIIATGFGNGEGIQATAGATGNGIEATGGATSGVGFLAAAAGGNSSGISATGFGSGHGISAVAGATGDGIRTLGGATSGAGAHFASAAGNSNGLTVAGFGSGHGVGIIAGATGHGIRSLGGATSGSGLSAEAQVSGDGFHGVGAGGGSAANFGGGGGGGSVSWDDLEGTEPSGAPPANASFRQILGYLKRATLNYASETAGVRKVYKDDSSTELYEQTITFDGTTRTRGRAQ